MIGTSRNVQVFACPEPTDMRRGYNGLWALARDVIGEDPMSGHLFLFVAKNQKRAKVLHWDGTGLCIYQKRLEKGRFAPVWEREKEGQISLSQSELSLFLEGSHAVRKKLSKPQYFLKKDA